MGRKLRTCEISRVRAQGPARGCRARRAEAHGWRVCVLEQVDVQTSVDRLMDMFIALGLRFVLVTSRGELTGIITKKDLLAFLELAPNTKP